MAEGPVRPQEKEPPSPGTVAGQEHPDLPADFYMKLLNLPACKQGKPCNGCGRCEH